MSGLECVLKVTIKYYENKSYVGQQIFLIDSFPGSGVVTLYMLEGRKYNKVDMECCSEEEQDFFNDAIKKYPKFVGNCTYKAQAFKEAV